MKKNVILAYVYSNKNAGDMAINLGAISLLKSFDNNIHINMLSRYNERNKEFINTINYFSKHIIDKNYNLISSPFILERDNKKIIQTKNYIYSFYNFLFPNKKYKILFKETDFLFFNGGNLIRCESISDYIRLLALSFPLKLALKYNKNYIILPNSTKKINIYGDKILKKYFFKSNIFITRENQSYNYLFKNYNLDNKNLYKSIDLAFFIDKKYFKKIELKKSYKNHIAFTFRVTSIGDLNEFDERKKDVIKNNIIKLINYILKLNKKILLVVQTNKDLEFTKNIYKEFKNNINVDFLKSNDPLELKKIYSEIDLLIGMRLHSIILALTEYTPAVGLFDEEWGLKNPGTMEQFELPYKLYIEDYLEIKKDILNILNNKNEYSLKIKNKIEEQKNNIIQLIKKEMKKNEQQ